VKIIIDECLPKKLTQFFTQDEVWTLPQIGLGWYSDNIDTKYKTNQRTFKSEPQPFELDAIYWF